MLPDSVYWICQVIIPVILCGGGLWAIRQYRTAVQTWPARARRRLRLGAALWVTGLWFAFWTARIQWWPVSPVTALHGIGGALFMLLVVLILAVHDLWVSLHELQTDIARVLDAHPSASMRDPSRRSATCAGDRSDRHSL